MRSSQRYRAEQSSFLGKAYNGEKTGAGNLLLLRTCAVFLNDAITCTLFYFGN